MLFIVITDSSHKLKKELEIKDSPEVKNPLGVNDSPAVNNILEVKDSFKSAIGNAIASVKESDLSDLEQRIHFFQLVKEKAQTPSSGITERSASSKENNSENRNKKTRTSSKDLSRLTIDPFDDEKNLDDNVVISVRYGLGEEEKLARDFYKQGSIDYIKLFYGDTGRIPPVFAQLSDVYAEQGGKSGVVSETMQNEEATATFMDVQYAKMTGAQSVVSFRERNRLDMWIKFNKDLFGMLQHSLALTQDIDYSRVG